MRFPSLKTQCIFHYDAAVCLPAIFQHMHYVFFVLPLSYITYTSFSINNGLQKTM